MRVAAIIAEYNPFHKGHAFHIAETKKKTDCDYLIVVMSGDFTQRGTPAFMPKHERAKIALEMGADLVIELPVTYASGTAERFAYGAVSLLDQLGCVGYLSFGCENDTLDALTSIAQLLANPPSSFVNDMNRYLKAGYTYPKARQTVIDEYYDFNAALLETPNNILAVEYLKALIKLESSIQAIAIKRCGSPYHEKAIHENAFPSATGIRELFETNMDSDAALSALASQIPETALLDMQHSYQKTWPISLDDFSQMMIYRIITARTPSTQDLSADLWDRIKNTEEYFTNISEFISQLKTKEMTYSRISRALTHLLLDTPSHFAMECPYARVLGFRKESSELLSHIKKVSAIPMITKLADASTILSGQALEMLSHDIQSAHLYNALVEQKYGTHIANEYRTVFPII